MKKILFSLFAISALCLGFVSCDEEVTEPGSIYGIVTDKATGEPISTAGVELSPTGMKTVTGSEGHFEFTGITPGQYTLIVTKTGYVDRTSNTIEVTAGATVKTDIQITVLPPALRVVDDDGSRVSSLDFTNSKNTDYFSIFNDGPINLDWEIVTMVSWISFSKISGTLLPGKMETIIATVDRTLMSSGANNTTIYVTSNNGIKTLEVAGGDGAPEYVVLEEYDLMVMTKDLGRTDKYSIADELCKKNTTAGFSDWRLPTIEELIIIYANRNEIRGSYYWENDKLDYYWSSTLYDSRNYTLLSFYDGARYSSHRSDNNYDYDRDAYVCAVRTVK